MEQRVRHECCEINCSQRRNISLLLVPDFTIVFRNVIPVCYKQGANNYITQHSCWISYVLVPLDILLNSFPNDKF